MQEHHAVLLSKALCSLVPLYKCKFFPSLNQIVLSSFSGLTTSLHLYTSLSHQYLHRCLIVEILPAKDKIENKKTGH